MPPSSPVETLREEPLMSLLEEPPRWFYDASLLFRRMALIELDQTELAENDPLLFRELQGVCALCRNKNRCVTQLDEPKDDHPDGWSEYCPNSSALAALGVEQNCRLAGRCVARDERVVVTRLGSVILRTTAN
jgi:hypothetical protein